MAGDKDALDLGNPIAWNTGVTLWSYPDHHLSTPFMPDCPSSSPSSSESCTKIAFPRPCGI